jgi:hypothetical protein
LRAALDPGHARPRDRQLIAGPEASSVLISRHAAGRAVAALRKHEAQRALAVLAAALLVVAVAAPALAQDGPTKLFDPALSARSVRAGTAITFSVSYRNREGSDPAYVRVVVAGSTRSLARTAAPGTVHDGLRYAGAFVLPTGTWSVRFEASDTRRFATTLDAGSVTVMPLPTPVPTATPRPTPRPTAQPGPIAKPGSTATPAPEQTPQPQGSPPSASPTASAPAGGNGTGPVASAPAPSATPDASPNGPAVGVGQIGGGDAGSGSGPSGDAPGSSGASGGSPFGGSVASAWLPPILGGRDLSPFGRVLSTALTTTATVTVVMSFALFGKRRHDSEPPAPDEVLLADAARSGPPAAGTLVPVPAPVDAELALPRWRRPSLLEARKADPSRMAPSTFNLTFDRGGVAAQAGLERRRIRYRVVRLLDGPDELLASEIGFLDEGDEVQLVERRGSFWSVLCPDGRSGWVHRMVLGDIVVAETEEVDDIDEDVLAAFLASRAEAS